MLYKEDKGLYLGGAVYPYTTSLSTPSPPPLPQEPAKLAESEYFPFHSRVWRW